MSIQTPNVRRTFSLVCVPPSPERSGTIPGEEHGRNLTDHTPRLPQMPTGDDARRQHSPATLSLRGKMDSLIVRMLAANLLLLPCFCSTLHVDALDDRKVTADEGAAWFLRISVANMYTT
jgi:hypothetical protein